MKFTDRQMQISPYLMRIIRHVHFKCERKVIPLRIEDINARTLAYLYRYFQSCDGRERIDVSRIPKPLTGRPLKEYMPENCTMVIWLSKIGLPDLVRLLIAAHVLGIPKLSIVLQAQLAHVIRADFDAKDKEICYQFMGLIYKYANSQKTKDDN